jgi:hypothetical protein
LLNCSHSCHIVTNKLQVIVTNAFNVSDGRGVGRYATIETQELRLPLRMGWKRETTVREYSKSGIRGDVVYHAPCGKKFKQYPDIMRVCNFELLRKSFSGTCREGSVQHIFCTP